MTYSLDGPWDVVSWHNDESYGSIQDAFDDALYYVCSPHSGWMSEMRKLAQKHGSLSWGDDDFGWSVHHHDWIASPNRGETFHIYWSIDSPKRDKETNRSFELAKVSKPKPIKKRKDNG